MGFTYFYLYISNHTKFQTNLCIWWNGHLQIETGQGGGQLLESVENMQRAVWILNVFEIALQPKCLYSLYLIAITYIIIDEEPIAPRTAQSNNRNDNPGFYFHRALSTTAKMKEYSWKYIHIKKKPHGYI